MDDLLFPAVDSEVGEYGPRSGFGESVADRLNELGRVHEVADPRRYLVLRLTVPEAALVAARLGDTLGPECYDLWLSLRDTVAGIIGDDAMQAIDEYAAENAELFDAGDALEAGGLRG